MFILAASRCGSSCIDDTRDVLVVVLLVGDYGDAVFTHIRVFVRLQNSAEYYDSRDCIRCRVKKILFVVERLYKSRLLDGVVMVV